MNRYLSAGVLCWADGAGKHWTARMLVDVKGRVEAGQLLREKGIGALFACLDGVLPPLVAAGEPGDAFSALAGINHALRMIECFCCC